MKSTEADERVVEREHAGKNEKSFFGRLACGWASKLPSNERHLADQKEVSWTKSMRDSQERSDGTEVSDRRVATLIRHGHRPRNRVTRFAIDQTTLLSSKANAGRCPQS